MSSILKRVETIYHEIPFEDCRCHKCGGGWWLTEDGKENDRTAINRAKVGTSCDCGGVYELDAGTYTRKEAGYVLVKCDCGREVHCEGFTSTCDCGRDYNWNGTQLADRSQWGEDTGEHWSECY